MNFFDVIFVVCVFQACSYLTVANSTESTTASTHGQSVPLKSPSHIIIRLRQGEKFPVCEGFLIGKNWALTAAGCVHKYHSSPETLEVVAGLTSTENIESQKHAQKRKVSEIKIHPDWLSSKKSYGDIGAIKVSRPFVMNSYVNPSSYGKVIVANETARLIGYGESEDIRSEVLKVLSKQACEKLGAYDPQLGNGTFCAKLKDNEEDEIYSAQSFAGAPVLSPEPDQNDVYGLTMSAGYGTFVNTTHYAGWIELSTNIKPIKSMVVQSSPPSNTTTTTSASASNETATSPVPTNGTTNNSTFSTTISNSTDVTTTPPASPTTNTTSSDGVTSTTSK